jgi:ectoine hydroxylase-related dioxygenase (phytanoyl-CoA dioxygenase family)
MWALTDFTEETGATRIVPGSHLWDHSPDYGTSYPTVPATMARGSVLVWHGSLWHGGGANRSDTRRVGIAMNYCAGYIRQQENQQLGIPRAVARRFPKRLRELVGYSVYNGLIGHIDKHDPTELLDADESAAHEHGHRVTARPKGRANYRGSLRSGGVPADKGRVRSQAAATRPRRSTKVIDRMLAERQNGS